MLDTLLAPFMQLIRLYTGKLQYYAFENCTPYEKEV